MELQPETILFLLVQFIRERHGATTINGELNGHTYKQSGFRAPTSKTGAKMSQHRFGRAADLKFSNTTVQEVYKDILSNFDLYSKYGLDRIYLGCHLNVVYTSL